MVKKGLEGLHHDVFIDECTQGSFIIEYMTEFKDHMNYNKNKSLLSEVHISEDLFYVGIR